MVNPCNPLENKNFTSDIDGWCNEGSKNFHALVGTLIELKQSMARLIVKHDDNHEIDALKKKLDRLASGLHDVYLETADLCKTKGDLKSCGFALTYENFADLFGPLDKFERNLISKAEIHFKPMRSGMLMIDAYGRNETPNIPKHSKTPEYLLDTGCSITVFSEQYYLKHAKNFQQLGHNQFHNLPLLAMTGLELNIGGIGHSPKLATLSPALNSMEGSDVTRNWTAILGLDFILPNTIEIDYDQSIIRFGEDIRKALSKGVWNAVPLWPISESFPMYNVGIEVLINGHPFKAIFDTGATTSSLDERCLSDLPNAEVKTSGSIIGTASGFYLHKELANVEITLGDSKIKMDRIGLEPENDPNAQLRKAVGLCANIGTDVLQRFHVVLDPQIFTLYLSPRRSDAKIFSSKGIGFVPERKDGQVIVRAVRPDSCAAIAGVKQGDVILKINGKDTRKMTIFEISELGWTERDILLSCRRDRKKIALKIKRFEEPLAQRDEIEANIKEYQSAAVREPSVDIYHSLIKACHDAKRFKDEASSYQKFADFMLQTTGSIYYDIALGWVTALWNASANLAPAIEYLEKISIGKLSPQADLSGIVELVNQYVDEMPLELRQQTNIKESIVQVYLNIGQASVEKGQYQIAEICCNRAFGLSPDNPAVKTFKDFIDSQRISEEDFF